MEKWQIRDKEAKEAILLAKRISLKERKHKLKMEEIERDYQRSRELTKESNKLRENNPPLHTEIFKEEVKLKRYKITRKVFYKKAYINDDIIYVDDYLNDYILNPIISIESAMFDYYLHSIYDMEENKFIREVII
jgi:hypothetical protein